MKTFKHKNGSIAEVHGELARACGYEFPAWMLGSDWQEVTKVAGKPEKDYEILAYSPTKDGGLNIESVKRLSDNEVFRVGYKDKYEGIIKSFRETETGLIVVLEDPSFIVKVPSTCTLDDLEKSRKPEKDYEILNWQGDSWKVKDILSVKRLSDGEVFSVGDDAVFSYNRNLKGKIYKFKESNNVIYVYWNDDKTGFIIPIHINNVLNGIKKSRQPILTTEDGVELFDEDKHYWVDDDMDIGEDLTDKSDPAKGYAYFSTREAAEDYRLWNYRGLSLMDINKIADIPEDDFKDLENLVKSRLP